MRRRRCSGRTQVSFLLDADLVEKLRKTRIAAEGIGHGLNAEVHETVVAFSIGSVKPVDCGGLLSQAGVDHREVQRRDVT